MTEKSFEKLMDDLQKEMVEIAWKLKGPKDEEDFAVGRIVLAIQSLKRLHSRVVR